MKWFQRFVEESEDKKGKWEKMAGAKIAKKNCITGTLFVFRFLIKFL